MAIATPHSHRLTADEYLARRGELPLYTQLPGFAARLGTLALPEDPA